MSFSNGYPAFIDEGSHFSGEYMVKLLEGLFENGSGPGWSDRMMWRDAREAEEI